MRSMGLKRTNQTAIEAGTLPLIQSRQRSQMAWRKLQAKVMTDFYRDLKVIIKAKSRAGKTDYLCLSSYSKSRIWSSLCPICWTRQFDRHALFRDRSRMLVQRTPHLLAIESAMIHLLLFLRHQGKGPCSSFCMSLWLTKDRHVTEGLF